MQKPETNHTARSTREVTIEKWVYGGRGLARLDGQVVLAPFVLPGEVVEVAVERERPGLVEARLLGVVTPSVERVAAPCPYFMRCGGCHYQHAPYEFQLARKVEVLREVLRRVGKLDAPEEIAVIAGAPLEYRNRVQLHLAGGEIGYLEAASNRLCPVEHCPVSSPAINAALGSLRKMRRNKRFPAFVRTIELFTNESEVQVNVLASAGQRLTCTSDSFVNNSMVRTKAGNFLFPRIFRSELSAALMAGEATGQCSTGHSRSSPLPGSRFLGPPDETVPGSGIHKASRKSPRFLRALRACRHAAKPLAALPPCGRVKLVGRVLVVASTATLKYGQGGATRSLEGVTTPAGWLPTDPASPSPPRSCTISPGRTKGTSTPCPSRRASPRPP